MSSLSHTYLAGVAVDDEGIDDLVSSTLKFVNASYFVLSKRPIIYLIGTKNPDEDAMDFLKNPNDLEVIKVFQGYLLNDDDEEPDETKIRQVFDDNSNLIFMDGGYWKIWLAFNYPEENSDDFEDLGEHWEAEFQQLAERLDDLALVGYNSEHEEIIWQEWADGDFDEGAISNYEQFEYYSGSNIESAHKINLDCFKLLSEK